MTHAEPILFEAAEFHGGGRILPQGDWSMQMHHHPYHEIIIVLRGEMQVCDPENVQLTAGQGDVLLYPAHAAHQETSSPENPVETLFFSFQGQVRHHRIQHRKDRNARIPFLAQALLEDFTTHQPFPQEKALLYLNLIAYELQAIEHLSANQVLVHKAKTFMRENMHRKLLLQDIADHCHFSPFHFARTYQKAAGQTPMAELKRMRLNMARALIRSTELPLKYIADQTGFSNEFHLSREFSKHFQETASACRKRS